VKYSAVNGFNVAGYEFGNEPDLFITAINATVPPWQFVQDIVQFKALLASTPSQSPLLAIAADVDFIPLTGDFAFTELMCAEAVTKNVSWDVGTWHFCELRQGARQRLRLRS
jgi:hypothetical protein